MLICQYCTKECKNSNSHRNHERLCKQNPNSQASSILASRAQIKSRECEFCNKFFVGSNFKKHVSSCKENPLNKKSCPVCEKSFVGRSITCSYSCSNKYFRTDKNNGNWKGKNYRSLAKKNHDMICIICGENKIVAVHHYDGNHSNNKLENLVPLCPTHHQYVHSRYKDLVSKQIEDYVNNKRRVA